MSFFAVLSNHLKPSLHGTHGWISAAVVLAILLGGGIFLTRSLLRRAARERLRGKFVQVMPASVIAKITRQPELLQLDGTRRTVSCLSCSMRDFGGLASSFADDPAALGRLLKTVLTPLMDAALERGGVVDRRAADGFSAFWNAPLDDPEHAIHACEAANAMMESIARSNELFAHERRNDGSAFPPIAIGIGVASGEAIAYGFEVHGRSIYSAAGHCAVQADALAGLSVRYGPAVVASEETRNAAERSFAFLEVDKVAGAPHENPLRLYAILGGAAMRASPKFRALQTFHDHIFEMIRMREWGKARALIEQCRKLSGASEKLYDLHLARIAYYEDHGPGADWDGAFRPILN